MRIYIYMYIYIYMGEGEGKYPNEYERISRADICIDDNCSVTRILRNLFRSLSAGDFKFTETVTYRIGLWPNCANVSAHQTATSPWKCDASTIQYPSQLSVSDSASEMILRIIERGALDRLIDIHFVVYGRR